MIEIERRRNNGSDVKCLLRQHQQRVLVLSARGQIHKNIFTRFDRKKEKQKYSSQFWIWLVWKKPGMLTGQYILSVSALFYLDFKSIKKACTEMDNQIFFGKVKDIHFCFIFCEWLIKKQFRQKAKKQKKWKLNKSTQEMLS